MPRPSRRSRVAQRALKTPRAAGSTSQKRSSLSVLRQCHRIDEIVILPTTREPTGPPVGSFFLPLFVQPVATAGRQDPSSAGQIARLSALVPCACDDQIGAPQCKLFFHIPDQGARP